MFGLTLLDLIVILAYMVIITWVGVAAARRVSTAGDYFAGGRTFNKWLMMMHSFGTGTHADDPVGVAGAAYERGVSGIWYTYAYLFLTPFYWIIAPVFRRLRFLTTADFFEARYGMGLSILYAVMGLVTFTVNIGTMLKGTGTIVGALTGGAVPGWVAVGVMTVIFVIYGLAGGLMATVFTEFFQGFLIILMSFLIIPFGLARIGGFEALHRAVPPEMFSLAAPEELTVGWIIAASIINLIGIVAQPHTMEVCATGKTEWEGRMGFTYGSFIKRVCAMGWCFIGLISYGLFKLQHREDAFGTAIRELLPSGFSGLMIAAILAAQMSTLSAFMVASSALFSRNIYKRILNTEASDRAMLWMGRISGFLVVAGGIAFSFWVQGVADAVTIFWAITTFTGVFMWVGVIWRRANRFGAWASFGVMTVLWLLYGPAGHIFAPLLGDVIPNLACFGDKGDLPYLVLAYLPAGVVTLILVSSCTRPEPQKALERFYLLLSTPVGQEARLREKGVEVVYAGACEPHPLESKYPRAVNVGGFLVALGFSFAMLGILWLLTRIGA